MKKSDVVHRILGDRIHAKPCLNQSSAYASANIALCKYWGKRNSILNLPHTSSLSISLGKKGTQTSLTPLHATEDQIILNGNSIDLKTDFAKRVIEFLDLFRGTHHHFFKVDSYSTIPIAAGLASSASGFASLVLALNELFAWQLSKRELSLLARLGSGSACRSLWSGFVEWERGVEENGMDSVAHVLPDQWPELAIGLCLISHHQKSVSSREAMQRTVDTSLLYRNWPEKVEQDLKAIKKAIHTRDFTLLGQTAESNALTMHGLMLSAWPPINYCLPETISAMQKVWACRQAGIPVYFTQDAGPNLKLLFLKNTINAIQDHFGTIEIIFPFF